MVNASIAVSQSWADPRIFVTFFAVLAVVLAVLWGLGAVIENFLHKGLDD